MSKYSLEDLLQLMARLREPEYGCPWDLAQSWETILPSTLEEAYEVADAIEQKDYPQVKDELGDLLFQIVFYNQLAREQELFDFDDITNAITTKLLRRHPHVFPDGTLESRRDLNAPAEQEAAIKASWEKIKQQERAEKGQKGVLDDIPSALPAINRAYKLQKRASQVGFDWDNVEGVYEKLDEEIQELKATKTAQEREDEMGDLLFTVVNLARHLKVDPEKALRSANNKFKTRFEKVENQAKSENKIIADEPQSVLNDWWDSAKV